MLIFTEEAQAYLDKGVIWYDVPETFRRTAQLLSNSRDYPQPTQLLSSRRDYIPQPLRRSDEERWEAETGMVLLTRPGELEATSTPYTPMAQRWWVRALVFLRLAGYR